MGKLELDTPGQSRGASLQPELYSYAAALRPSGREGHKLP